MTVAVPGATPVTVVVVDGPGVTVAIPPGAMLQVPDIDSLKVIKDPVHTLEGPVIGVLSVLTVTVTQLEQPLGIV